MRLFLHRLLDRARCRRARSRGPQVTDVTDRAILVAVVDLYRLGATTGTSEPTFSPNDLVTREQMAAVLARSVAIVSAIRYRKP